MSEAPIPHTFMTLARAIRYLLAFAVPVLADMRTQMLAILKDTLNWDKFEPMAVKAYRDNLTQADVDAMVKFYRSPAGRAVIEKVPKITQTMMAEMQDSLQQMVPKVQALETYDMSRGNSFSTFASQI